MKGPRAWTRRLAGIVLAVAMAAAATAQAAAPPPAAPENPIGRFEIVSLGSFPIMLFYTGFAFDLTQYAASNFDSAYAPWPFKNEYSAPLSDADRLTRIGVALGACVVVGAVDAYIHAQKARAAKRLRAASLEASADPGQ